MRNQNRPQIATTSNSQRLQGFESTIGFTDLQLLNILSKLSQYVEKRGNYV